MNFEDFKERSGLHIVSIRVTCSGLCGVQDPRAQSH